MTMMVSVFNNTVTIITEHHDARIEYMYRDGQPAAAIYYDDQIGEIVEAQNGMTLRYAYNLAKSSLRLTEYLYPRFKK